LYARAGRADVKVISACGNSLIDESVISEHESTAAAARDESFSAFFPLRMMLQTTHFPRFAGWPNGLRKLFAQIFILLSFGGWVGLTCLVVKIESSLSDLATLERVLYMYSGENTRTQSY
jgi:hypothetical protein